MLRPLLPLVVAAVAAATTTLATGQTHDQLPQDATAGSRTPACFGAASHDPERPCVNPQLRHTVVPSPGRLANLPSAPCASVRADGLLTVCTYGVPSDRATRTVALVGDSHAAHWRAALDPVARSEGWHGVSLARSSCPLSTAPRDVPEPNRSGCVRWNQDVLRWLGEHPEVDTLFVSQLTGGKGVIGPDGRDSLAARKQGYLEAWSQVPASVQRIIVIRDTPKTLRSGRMAPCVTRAVARRRAAGPMCSVSRRDALDPDAAVMAARSLGSARVRSVDLTPYFCGTRRCEPVIGGVLAYKDAHHLTPAYMKTMAPYLRRGIDEVLTAGSASAAVPVRSSHRVIAP